MACYPIPQTTTEWLHVVAAEGFATIVATAAKTGFYCNSEIICIVHLFERQKKHFKQLNTPLQINETAAF